MGKSSIFLLSRLFWLNGQLHDNLLFTRGPKNEIVSKINAILSGWSPIVYIGCPIDICKTNEIIMTMAKTLTQKLRCLWGNELAKLIDHKKCWGMVCQQIFLTRPHYSQERDFSCMMPYLAVKVLEYNKIERNESPSVVWIVSMPKKYDINPRSFKEKVWLSIVINWLIKPLLFSVASILST